MRMEEHIISKAIIETYIKELTSHLELDVAIAGAGPSGLVCAYYLASAGKKVAVFERHLKIGGGMPGGGMMFNRIVVQEEAKEIMKEFGVRIKKYSDNLYTADAVETISAFSLKTIKAGAKLFNLISVEDVIIRERKITGVVLNWTAVDIARLHIDPLGVKAKFVVDATGHDSEICRIVERKLGDGFKVAGEKSMWAEKGEAALIENTKEVYPGLLVCGMAANAVAGSHRMGAIFGGMLISGKKASSLILEKL
ncbi:MAG TPA: sulfide-dependent adenosine diphosphate thiazole synthase [bacterium]|nr:sulfide-dependent adenosine diphosphate thiazole synthase [bacterium]HPP30204.1 sulfide-dependent adenosine diphosphate thiazole synthase [bacterium]